jgi:LysM repeat protein
MFERRLDVEHAFGQDVSMTRTRVRRRRTLTVLAILACLLVTGPVSRAFAPHEPRAPRLVYVVRGGDTVWTIAVRFAGGADPRDLVDAIGRRNHIDAGAIVPGQTLVIPALA